MSPADWTELVVGLLVVGLVLQDLFVGVVVPRPAPGRLRPSAVFLRTTWRLWRSLVGRLIEVDKRESLLGSYAPLAVLMLLALWVLGLVFGFGLALHGLRAQIRPVPADWGTSFYFSAVSLLTIGFGDYVPTAGPARVLVLVEAASGLGVVALTISFLFSLYANFQQREVQVIALDSLAGAPPSGVLLLENARRLELVDHLGQEFDEWQQWAAQVLESHLAYPVLNYFRSSHDNESWVSSLGAMLDAAVLVVTTVKGGPKGHARLFYDVGNHLVEDLSSLIRLDVEPEAGVERFEWEQARAALTEAGWELGPEEVGWQMFVKLRSRYAMRLNAIARHFASPPTRWIGDRSKVRHGRVIAAAKPNRPGSLGPSPPPAEREPARPAGRR